MQGFHERQLLSSGRAWTGVATALILALIASTAQAVVIPVPNSDLDTLYKPGTGETVNAAATNPLTPLGGWANPNGSLGAVGGIAGLAPCCGSITWSDGSIGTGANGDTVEIPGWQGTGAVQGSGNPGWDMAQNGNERFTSFASLGTIGAGLTYTLSVDALGVSFSGNSSTINSLDLELLANGVSVGGVTTIPLLYGTWANYSATFTAAQLSSLVGQSLTITVGGGGTGDQTQIDNISLTAVPEPGSLALAMAGLGMLGACWGWRRRAA